MNRLSRYFENFKVRWGINSNLHLALILFVFAISGMSFLYVKETAYEFLGIVTPGKAWYYKVFIFVFVGLPLYHLVFFFWCIVLGQYTFLKLFLKKSTARFRRKRRS